MGESTLERAVYIQEIDPEHVEAYVRAHDDVPSAVTDAMDRAGVERFDLYVRGTVAVCIVEAHDVEKYFDAMDGDEGVKDWERRVGAYKLEGVDVDADEGASIPMMDRIWHYTPE